MLTNILLVSHILPLSPCLKARDGSSRLEVFCKKETVAQVFSCEFCEISENTFSYKTPWVAASAVK